MKVPVLTFALACVAFGQPAITNLTLPKVSHGAAAVTWMVSEDSSPRDSRIYYGVTPALGSSTLIYSNWDSGSVAKYRQLTLSGLQPGTTYYFKPESKSASGTSSWSCSAGESGIGWSCDPNGSRLGMFTTSPLPANHLGDPALPQVTMDTSQPTVTGSTFTVAPNCSNLQTQINACAAANANLNHDVVIPAGASCTGEYTLPAKTGVNAPGSGWCNIRTSALDRLPPEGVRISPAYGRFMPTIRVPLSARGQLARTAAGIGTAAGTQGWRLTGIKVAPETKTPRVLTVQSIDSNGKITFTQAHGLETHQIVTIGGIKGTYKPLFYGPQYTLLNGMNGTWRITPASTNSITLQGLTHSTICPAPPCYTSGGYAVVSSGIPITAVSGQVVTTATKHGLPQMPWTNIVSISGKVLTVADGDSIGPFDGPVVEIAGGPAAANGLWGTVPTTSETVVTLGGSFPSLSCSYNCGRVRLKTYLQIDNGQGVNGLNGAHTYEVVDDTHIRLETPLTGTYAGGGVLEYDPDYWHALVRMANTSSRFILDRCWITGGGFPNRIYTGAMLNGSDIAVINSRFDEINNWLTYRKVNRRFQPSPMGNTYRYTATAIALEFTDARRLKLENNYINAEGISIFAQEGGPTNPTDIVIRRNYFWSDPRKMAGGAGSFERYYPKRHLLEFKPVERALMEGNVFDGNWADYVGCGPAISLRSLGDSNSYDNTIEDVTIRNNVLRNTASGIAVIGSDYYVNHYYLFSRRLKIDNNVAYAMDKRKWQSNPFSANPGTCGFFTSVSHGMEDVEISNNTVHDNRGSQPQFLSYGGARMEGLKITNNIWVHNHDNGAGAIRYDGDGASTNGILPSPQSGTTPYEWFRNWFPNAVFAQNVVIPGVKNTNSDANYESTSSSMNYSIADAQTYYSGFPDLTIVGQSNDTASGRIRRLKFQSPVNQDFRLRYDSPGMSGNRASGPRRTAGANIDELEAAQGRVKNVRVVNTGRTKATLGYEAPDAEACFIDFGTDGAFNIFSRITDGGGATARLVNLETLNPGAVYHYRIQCAVEQPQGTIVTAP